MDDEHSLELQAKIAEDIEKTLLAQEFNAAVLCQTIKPTDELKELAKAHDVSVGKAQLIQDIASQNEDYTFEELATLSINELSLLTESTEVDLENVSSVGNASTKAYIEESVAIDAALAAAGLDASAELVFEEFECELEFENGKMVYEIEFIYNDNKHEYDIDALTGELVNSEVQIIFITGYPDFIAEGYEVSAVHYLMKPVKKEKLHEVLSRAAARLEQTPRFFVFSSGKESYRINADDIRYAESDGHYVVLHTTTQDYRFRMTVPELEGHLDHAFYRCSRSFVVGLKYIVRITKNTVVLEDGTELPLGKGQYDDINLKFIQYLREK